jgi:hypothetical protein
MKLQKLEKLPPIVILMRDDGQYVAKLDGREILKLGAKWHIDNFRKNMMPKPKFIESIEAQIIWLTDVPKSLVRYVTNEIGKFVYGKSWK